MKNHNKYPRALKFSLMLTLNAVLLVTSVTFVEAMPAQKGAYRLGAQDVLQMTVENHPDLDGILTVRPDGKVSIAGAGELVARGKTAAQLAREIEARLARNFNNAPVQIVVKQARPQQARIIGAVNSVGTYELSGDSHLVDLVAQAGGLSTKANRVSGRLIRAGQVTNLNVTAAIKKPDSAANIALLPEDLVVLDAVNYAHQITVMGEVAKPGAYDLDEDLTVTALLAQAGGPTNKAALRGASVLREGKPVLTDLSAIKDGVPADSPLARFRFEPGDVLSIPENTSRFGVMGQVARPSYYPLPEDAKQATVLKALSQAGGALANGDLSQMTLTRNRDGQIQTIPIDAAAILAGEAPDTILLQRDDVLLVPVRQERKVSVIGQVPRPGAYPLTDDTTLLSLLAQAGNPLKGAGLTRSYVLREGKQIPLDLHDAVISNRPTLQIAKFKLLPDDVLVIRDISDQIQVIGQVAQPGPYALDDDLSMMSLLAKAGNPTATAALGSAYVLRDGKRIPFDLRSTIAGNLDSKTVDFHFEPGDVLVVPENQLRFAVMGQVAKPGYYPYPENPKDATVLNVLGTAGGPTNGGNGANLSDAGIIRTVNGQPTRIPIRLTDTLKTGENSDLQLQPGDVLYIPPKNKRFSWADVLLPLSALRGLGIGF